MSAHKSVALRNVSRCQQIFVCSLLHELSFCVAHAISCEEAAAVTSLECSQFNRYAECSAIIFVVRRCLLHLFSRTIAIVREKLQRMRERYDFRFGVCANELVQFKFGSLRRFPGRR